MSATVSVKGKDFVVVAGDSMSPRDAVNVMLEGCEEVRFVKVAGTIQEPPADNAKQLFLAFNHDDRIKKLRPARKIVRSPGSRLYAFGDFFYSPKTFARVIQPILADMQAEYFKALAENRRLKAEWTRSRGYLNFWIALVLHMAKKLLAIRKISRLG